MSHEPIFSKKKKKNSNLVWIIVGITAITGIGTITYFAWPKKDTKTETKQITEQKVQQLQNQLSQIKKALTTLNNNIAQTKSSLQQKQTEQIQTPQSSNLQTEINQLKQQLTTYKKRKQKIEAIIPSLERRISNLGKGDNGLEPNEQKIIEQVEREIKKINQELGINSPPQPNPDKPIKNPQLPKEKNDDLPNKDKKPNPDPDKNKPKYKPTNTEWFEITKNWSDKLNQILDKMNKEYKEAFDNYDSIPQQSKDIIDAMFEGSAKNFIEACRINHNQNEVNKKGMNKYFTKDEEQKFAKLDENSQKSYLELVDSIIEPAVGDIKRQLEQNINYFKKMVKFGEEMFAGLSELGTTPELEQAKQELQKQKNIIADCEKKLTDDYQQAYEHYSHRIPIVKQIWEQMEKLDWNPNKK